METVKTANIFENGKRTSALNLVNHLKSIEVLSKRIDNSILHFGVRKYSSQNKNAASALDARCHQMQTTNINHFLPFVQRLNSNGFCAINNLIRS